MFQDDTKVLLAKPEVSVLLDTVQKQQQQFSDLQEHISLDPLIPITFTKVHIILTEEFLFTIKAFFFRLRNNCYLHKCSPIWVDKYFVILYSEG